MPEQSHFLHFVLLNSESIRLESLGFPAHNGSFTSCRLTVSSLKIPQWQQTEVGFDR